jgi:hypothetical protein
MDTKDQLVDAVKKWITLDNELKELSKLAKEKRDQKKNLSLQLMNVMKSNDIECVDLNDGQLCYKKSKSKKPLNKDSLLQILQKYFKDIDEPNSRSIDVAQFILNNRDVVDKETILRKIKKG